MKNYLTNLNRKLTSIKTNEITSEQWIQMTRDDQNVFFFLLKQKLFFNLLVKIKNESYLAENTEWVHCKGSTPNFRGFPCSLWTLFHTLTVRQYELGVIKSQPCNYPKNL